MPDDEISSAEPPSGEGSGAPGSTAATAPSIDVEGPLFASLVEAAAWGEASDDDLAVLEAHKGAWQRELVDRLTETDDALDQLRSHRRPDDQQVLDLAIRMIVDPAWRTPGDTTEGQVER